MSLHTRGPWTVGPVTSWYRQRGISIFAPVRGMIARVRLADAEGLDGEAEANANLMSAAPELLAFATAFLDMANKVTGNGAHARPTVDQLNALLVMALAARAKAEGRS